MTVTAQQSYDVVVVGGGAFGSWCAIECGKRTANVALVEQFEPTHENGSSHGDGRIYRMVYSDDVYLDMMALSISLWRELEDKSKTSLLEENGCIFFDERDDGPWSIAQFLPTLKRNKVDYYLLDEGEVSKRFPQFRGCKARKALFVPSAGSLFASKCVRAAWDYCTSLGVETLSNQKVIGLTRNIDGNGDALVLVKLANGRELKTKKVILAPGAWLSSLAGTHLEVSLCTKVTSETVCYYSTRETGQHIPDHTYTKMPAFIFQVDNELSPFGFYGLPDICHGVKIGLHCSGVEIDIERRCATLKGTSEQKSNSTGASAQERVSAIVESINRLVADHFPWLTPTPCKTQSCLYTITPSHDLVISEVQQWGGSVIVVGGGSGHGFKMSPAVGCCAAALALNETPPVDVSRFSINKLECEEFVEEIASR